MEQFLEEAVGAEAAVQDQPEEEADAVQPEEEADAVQPPTWKENICSIL